MEKLLNALFESSIGRKWVMAITGIGAMLFLIMHLSGNLLFYLGPETINHYAEWLHSQPFLPFAEAGLGAVFVFHIVFSILLTIQNRKAKGRHYAVSASAGERTLASKSMILSGILILAYILFHVWGMRFGPDSDLLIYDRMVKILKNPLWNLCYLIGILFVGIHLSHGASSSIQSLGLRFPKYERLIKLGGGFFALSITLGFASFPAYIWFCK